MNWRKVILSILAGLFFFMLIGAIGSHILLQQTPLNGFGSASFLFVAGALVLLSAPKTDRLRLLIVGGLGFIAEVVGVKFGWLFGRYTYTEVLAPNISDVPLAMVFAWLILIGYVKQLMGGIKISAWGEIVLSGLWMTTIDLMLDPVAAHPFHFWMWIDTGVYYGIPAHNFLGWFVVSGVIFALDKAMFKRRWDENVWARVVGLSIIVLYSSSAFAYGYVVAGCVGILLVGGHMWLIRKTNTALTLSPHKINSASLSN
ncbi:MAG: carotenoid biosynthesis protein [Acidobacteria bacterium]|nr:carotenoid biosynthesis protein [Acidobacteriota bacterium]